ncbi:winged helix-turn-helix transcriptional regulator [Odoribacter lunatus]|uniref:winged helix-turn-helix transcriptional regulator n=1 Tax=Odoribacter lunatus TaxID=2941335 RepID=UPI00203D30D9|nr:helix-turn-helix domain-containing protein [Odoribacter lunatus]
MGKNLDYEYCPSAPVLEWFSNKWALVVLLKLRDGKIMRFNELYRSIPVISEKVLAQTLHLLEKDGLITKIIYPEVPPRSEYRLTPLGTTLLPHLDALMQWGQENMVTILQNRGE